MTTFIDIESGGFKHNEVVVMMGRRTGKSTYYKQYLEEREKIMFQKVDEAVVDGEQWYTISTRKKEVSSWLRNQPANMRKEVLTAWEFDAFFDISEKLYMMLELKFK